MKYFLFLFFISFQVFAKDEVIDFKKHLKNIVELKDYCVNNLTKHGLTPESASKACDCYFINNIEKLHSKQLNDVEKEEALLSCIVESVPVTKVFN